MQINGLLSMLMNLPSASAGASLLGVADSLNNAKTTGDQVGFSGLLGADSNNPNAKNSLLTDNTPPGDIIPTPQVNNIAVPPIPMYIDQPIKQNGVQVADNSNLTIANDAAKTTSKGSQFDNLINTKAIASELKNNQEFASYGNLSNPSAIPQVKTDDLQGKLDLTGLNLTDNKNNISSEEFQSALANIEQMANKKNEAKPELYSNAKITSAKEIKADERTALNDSFKPVEPVTEEVKVEEAVNILAEKPPTKHASKLHTNTLASDEVKTESKSNAVVEDDFSAKLQELNNQLKAAERIEGKQEEISQKSVTDQVQIKISQAAANGQDSIKIKLQPAELGMVDVEMRLDNDGNTQIRIVAERAETLEMLRKDSHALSQSLNDAGIKTNTGGLEFSLRGGNQQQFAQNQQHGFGHNQGNHYGKNDAYGYNNKSSNTDREYTINMAQTKGLNILA